MVPPRTFIGTCSRFRLALGQGPGGFPIRRTRALRRTLRISSTRAARAAWASVSVRMVRCSCPPIASAWIWWISKTGAQVCRSGGLCRPLALGYWLPVTVGHPGGSSTSPSIPWCAASGAEPTARGSRGHAPGCKVPASPYTTAVRGSGGWLWGRGVGPSGRAARAGSMEPTASRFQWHSCGCGVIPTW